MANEWLDRLAKGLRNLSRDTKIIVGKHLIKKEVDLTKSVQNRIRAGLDAEGNPLEPLRPVTLQSLVTDDRRPNETVLGARLSFGSTPMVATGRTLEAIIVKGRGTQLEIIITDPKALQIIEWHSQPSITKNSRGRKIHLASKHNIVTNDDTVIHRPARKIIGLSDRDVDGLADSLMDEIDRQLGGIL